MAIPQNEIDRCNLSWATKVLCSGIFITGREPEEMFPISCAWIAASEKILKQALKTRDAQLLMNLPVDIKIDRDTKSVSVELDGIEAHARFLEGQGTIVCDSHDMQPHFEPQPVLPNPAPQGQPWEDATQETPDGVRKAVDLAFSNPRQFTNAFLVLHKGKLIAERYSPQFDANTRFEAWSMGKSLSASFVGVAEKQGLLSLDEPANFPEWQDKGDERQKITVANLLNMASGLQFTGSYGQDDDPSVKSLDGLFVDHTYVYAGGVDSYKFSVNKPLADEPNSAGRYRNCDPILAAGLVRHRAENGDIQAFLNWPQKNLFDPLGMENMVLETDPYGHFLISGHDYGTARDWARLGLLYQQRGAWHGKQILNESFVDFVQTPAEYAWRHAPYYGGFFCTNATNVLTGLPRDAFWMSGGGRQRVVIVPSKDLVIVRMGHMAGLLAGVDETLNEVYGMVVNSV